MDPTIEDVSESTAVASRNDPPEQPPPYFLEGPGLQYEEDSGWDAIPESEDAERQKKLDKRLYRMGYMASKGGNHYVYIDTEHVWHLLMSRSAQSRICAIAGMKNVSTGSAEATSFLITWLTKRCASRVSLPPQSSVCFGTRRLEVSLEGDRIDFTNSRSLVAVSDHAEDRAREMCVSPVSTTMIPRSWISPGEGAVHNYISPMFSDKRGLDLLKWHIGNCLLEPTGTPRTLVLAGDGGGGKSTILNIIASAMGTCCSTLPSGTFTVWKEAGDRLSKEAISQLVGSRMVLAYDVNLEERRLNTHAVKEICGEDHITDGTYTSKLICSVTMATNGYMDPLREPIVQTDAIMRRMIVLPMEVSALHPDVPRTQPPEMQASFVDFLCSCVHVRMLHNSAPLYYSSILASICHDRYKEAVALIEESDNVSLADSVRVLSILRVLTMMSTSQVIYKASLVSPGCVHAPHGIKVIRGLKPRGD